MEKFFKFDERLGIQVPYLTEEWDTYDENTQQTILFQWEGIRGHIPDRIFDLEIIINQKQAQLSNENNFQISCQLNSDISDLASIINDLWLWYRSNQDITTKQHM